MKIFRRRRSALHATLCATVLILAAQGPCALAAPVDDRVPYQGRLLDGTTPVSGIRAMEFCLYDGPDPSTSLQLACDFQAAVGVQDGIFNTRLDFGPIDLSQAVWLQVSVDDDGTMVPLEPLTSLGASPQAAFAVDAGSLEGFQASDFALAGHSHPRAGAGSGLVLANDTYSVAADGETIAFEGNSIAVQAGRGIQTSAAGVEAHPDGVTIGFTADNRLTVLGGTGGPVGGYEGVAIVSPVNGDYADPIAAMNDRATWCDQSSGSSRCLMFIQPGTYELASTLVLRPGIAIIGAQRDLVTLSRSTSGSSNTVINGDSCTTGCWMESLTVFGAVQGSGLLKTMDMGGSFAELRDMVIIANGHDDLATALDSSGNELIVHDVIVSATGSSTVFPIRVAAGSSLEISQCLVIGHSFGGAATGLFILDGSASTRDCRFRMDRRSNFSSSSQGVSVTDGTYRDSGSVFEVGAAGSADGIWGSSCAGGRLQLEGTRISVDGDTAADGIDLSTCGLLARNVRINSSTSNSVGVRVVDGNLELRHAAIDVSGNGVIGTSISPLSLSGTISHSVIDAAGGDLVNFQQGLRLLFSELRGTGTINALSCRALTAGASFTFYANTCP